MLPTMQTLPDEAHCSGPLGAAKSYTLRCPHDPTRATIGVILNRKWFYISPVYDIPPGDAYNDCTINAQQACQVKFDDDVWEKSKVIAGW